MTSSVTIVGARRDSASGDATGTSLSDLSSDSVRGATALAPTLRRMFRIDKCPTVSSNASSERPCVPNPTKRLFEVTANRSSGTSFESSCSPGLNNSRRLGRAWTRVSAVALAENVDARKRVAASWPVVRPNSFLNQRGRNFRFKPLYRDMVGECDCLMIEWYRDEIVASHGQNCSITARLGSPIAALPSRLHRLRETRRRSRR